MRSSSRRPAGVWTSLSSPRTTMLRSGSLTLAVASVRISCHTYSSASVKPRTRPHNVTPDWASGLASSVTWWSCTGHCVCGESGPRTRCDVYRSSADRSRQQAEHGRFLPAIPLTGHARADNRRSASQQGRSPGGGGRLVLPRDWLVMGSTPVDQIRALSPPRARWCRSPL